MAAITPFFTSATPNQETTGQWVQSHSLRASPFFVYLQTELVVMAALHRWPESLLQQHRPGNRPDNAIRINLELGLGCFDRRLSFRPKDPIDRPGKDPDRP